MNNKITFETLTLRNFMSYGNNLTTVNLNQPGTTMIQGEDLDNTTNGRGVNGIGKTTLMNALTFCIYGKSLTDAQNDKLINNINKKNMVVTCQFRKGNDVFYIERARKTKEGNYVKFEMRNLDGSLKKDLARSKKDTDEIIKQEIGIPYDLFCQIIVFSATKTPFLDLPVRHASQANQTAMIEELFGLTELTEKADIIKANTKILNQQVDKLEIQAQQIEREKARHLEHISTAKQRVVKWEQDRDQTIQKYKDSLARVQSFDFETEQKVHDQLDVLKTKIDSLTRDKQTCDKELLALVKQKKSKTTELTHLNDQKCPYCLQEYVDATSKIDNLLVEIDEIESMSEELATKSLSLEEEIASLTEEQKLLKTKKTVDNLSELVKIKAQSEQMVQKIAELSSAENPYIEPLEELENTKLDDVDYTELNDLKKRIEHEKFLVKLLTKQDSFVRKVLLNKNLPFLNKRMTYYLTELGLPHKVEFNNELEAVISKMGNPFEFCMLSSGQRARVNIALSLSFRDVLQQLHTPINVCLFDEVLDVGLDSVGVQAAGRLLKRLAHDNSTNVFIISHREELEGTFDRVLTVQMDRGFSNVKE